MIEPPDFSTHPVNFHLPESEYVSRRFGADPDIMPFLMIAADGPSNLLGRPLLRNKDALGEAARKRISALPSEMSSLSTPFERMFAPDTVGRLSLVPKRDPDSDVAPSAPSSAARPWLSVVAVSRNDDHGKRMLERNQAFVDGLVRACERGGASVELVLVEWNPPADRPCLADALSFPSRPANLTIKIITVPEEVHARYRHASQLPLYQMIGKNVGIRRAQGEYILATNVDIVPSDQLSSLLLQNGEDAILRPDRFYRSDRWDLDPTVLDYPSIDSILDAADGHTRRINLASGSIASTRPLPDKEADVDHRGRSLPDLHLNACGDFQLAHHRAWDTVFGYPEFDGYSFHLDSLLAYQLHFAGYSEHRLPSEAMHFHIDHVDGWSPETEQDGGFRKSLKRRGLPALSFSQLLFFAHLMQVCDLAVLFNDTGWGLKNVDLPTTVLHLCGGDPDGASIDRERHATQVPDVGPRYDPFQEAQDSRQAQFKRAIIETCLRHTEAEIRERISDGSDGKRPLVVWGVGRFGQLIAAQLEELGVEINYFADGWAEEESTSDAGYPVKTIGYLKSALALPDSKIGRPFIVIASSFADSIRDQLMSLGAEPGVDFIVPA